MATEALRVVDAVPADEPGRARRALRVAAVTVLGALGTWLLTMYVLETLGRGLAAR